MAGKGVVEHEQKQKKSKKAGGSGGGAGEDSSDEGLINPHKSGNHKDKVLIGHTSSILPGNTIK